MRRFIYILMAQMMVFSIGCTKKNDPEHGGGVSDTDTDSDGDGDSTTGAKGDSDGSWKFIVVGDTRGSVYGLNTDVWSHMVEAIVAEGAEFVLFAGDLVTRGMKIELEQWIEATQPLYSANMGVYVVRGNHDSSSLEAWNEVFKGPYRLPKNGPRDEKNLTYKVTHRNVFVAGIDNYSSPQKVNQTWLDAKLSENTAPHVFVFGHEPAFAASHTDTMDDHPSTRDTFWRRLEAAGARAFFCGHDHFYDHARIDDGDGDSTNDIHQFIVGTGGAPLRDFDGNYVGDNGKYTPVRSHFSSQYGYMVVLIEGLDATLTFMERESGKYVAKDSFKYSVK